MDSLEERQPHLVIKTNDGIAHVLSITLLRRIASGQEIADNELSSAIARALLDYIEV